MVHVDARYAGETGVAIRLTVTTTHRIKQLHADVRLGNADSLATAVAIGRHAVLAGRALRIIDADQSTDAIVLNADAGFGGETCVAISDPVASAHRVIK